MTPPKPSYASTLAKALAISADRHGMRAYVPTYVLLSIGVGGFTSWFVPQAFWVDSNWGASVAAFVGVLTFNGILLAVGWNAFSRIYEALGSKSFSSFLRKHNLLDLHLMFIETVHYSLTLSAGFSLFALLALLVQLPLWIDQSIFAFVIATTLYSIIQAMRAIGMMNALTWELAHTESDEYRGLRAVASPQEKSRN